MITQGYLRAIFDYNPETGLFKWMSDRKGRNKDGPAGNLNNTGYRQITIDYKIYSVSRLVWMYVYGEWPEYELDHINGIRDDNRLENLRAVTRFENMKNRQRPKNNSSGEIGVSWEKDRRQWKAYIAIDGKNKRLGSFDNKMEAIYERRKASQIHGFHANHGRV